MWVAEQTFVQGNEWSSVRRLAAHLYASQTGFWGTARDRSGPGVLAFLKSPDSCGAFKVRRVAADDGSFSDMVRLDEEALREAAAAAIAGTASSARTAGGCGGGNGRRPAGTPPAEALTQGRRHAKTDDGNAAIDDDGDDSGDDDGDEQRLRGGGDGGGGSGTQGAILLARVRELADAVWPPVPNEMSNLARAARRVLAARLASQGALSRRRAMLLAPLGRYVHQHPALGGDAAVAAHACRGLGSMLRDGDSRGAFRLLRNESGGDVVYLSLRALQAAADGGGDGHRGLDDEDDDAGAASSPLAARGRTADRSRGRTLDRSRGRTMDRSRGRTPDRSRGRQQAHGVTQTPSWQEPGGGAVAAAASAAAAGLPDWGVLEGTAARVCGSSLRGRVWWMVASLLWGVEIGPLGPRSRSSKDLLDDMWLLTPELASEAASHCGGKIRLRDLIAAPAAAGGGEAVTQGSCPFLRPTWTEMYGEVVVLDGRALLRLAAADKAGGGAAATASTASAIAAAASSTGAEEHSRPNIRGPRPSFAEPAAARGDLAPPRNMGAEDDPWVSPFERELRQRFPSSPPAAPSDPLQEQAAAVAEAKRSIVRLLAAMPPPHEMDFQQLGESMRGVSGGARPARNLWLLCAEEPSVLQVVAQGERQFAVRLTCPVLAALAGGGHPNGRVTQQQTQHQHQHHQPQQQHQQQRRQAAGAAVANAAVDAALRGGGGGGGGSGGSSGGVAPGRPVPEAAATKPLPSSAAAVNLEDALEAALLARFPPPPGAGEETPLHNGADGTAVTAAFGDPGCDDLRSAARPRQAAQSAVLAAARRCVARLLALAPPPHKMEMAQLGMLLPAELGRGWSQLVGQTLRQVLAHEPDVFELVSTGTSHYEVRLVCPRLLELARHQATRAGAATTAAAPAARSRATAGRNAAAGGGVGSASDAVWLGISGSTAYPPPAKQPQQQQPAHLAMVTSGAAAANAAAVAAAAATAAATSAAVKAALARAARVSALGGTSGRQQQQRQEQDARGTAAAPGGAGLHVGAAAAAGGAAGRSGGGGGGDVPAQQKEGPLEMIAPVPRAVGPDATAADSLELGGPKIAAATTVLASAASRPDGGPPRARIPIPVPVLDGESDVEDSGGGAAVAAAAAAVKYGHPAATSTGTVPRVAGAAALDGVWRTLCDAARAQQHAGASPSVAGATVPFSPSADTAAASCSPCSEPTRHDGGDGGSAPSTESSLRETPQPAAAGGSARAEAAGTVAEPDATVAAAVAAAAGVRGSAGSSSPPRSSFESALSARLCPDPRLRGAAAQRAAAVAAAQRGAARALAAQPPPHELPLSLLETWVASAEEYSLEEALAEEQRVFALRIGPSHGPAGDGSGDGPLLRVRLVCPALLRLAEGARRQPQEEEEEEGEEEPLREPLHEQQREHQKQEATRLSRPGAAFGGAAAAAAGTAEAGELAEARGLEDGGGDARGGVTDGAAGGEAVEAEAEVAVTHLACEPSPPPSPEAAAELPPQPQAPSTPGPGRGTPAAPGGAGPANANPPREGSPPVRVPVPVPVPVAGAGRPRVPVPVPVPVVEGVHLAEQGQVPAAVAVAVAERRGELAAEEIPAGGAGAGHKYAEAEAETPLRPPASAWAPTLPVEPRPPSPPAPITLAPPAPQDYSEYAQPPPPQQTLLSYQPHEYGYPHPNQPPAAPGSSDALLLAPWDEHNHQPPWDGSYTYDNQPPQPPPMHDQQQQYPRALPDTQVYIVHNPHTPEFGMMMEHCYSSPQLGLAVHYSAGVPAVVAVYAPPLMFVGGDGQELDLSYGMGFPAAVYLVDCTAGAAAAATDVDGAAAAAALEEEAAAVGVIVDALRGLLEDVRVQKVVYGCAQTVDALEAATGAAIAPVLDVRVLLDGLLAMLPPLPPPPSAAAVAESAEAEAAAMAQLAAHAGALRDALAGTGLWAERPELLAALLGRHVAAVQDELWVSTGRDRSWLSRPLSAGQVAAAAGAARHLPELWAAVAGEAMTWVAVAAAAGRLDQLRAARQGAAAAAAAASRARS